MSMSHYCIVRADLSHGLRAANLIHAAGESSPGELPEHTRAVALEARDEEHLLVLEEELRAAQVEHTPIREDGELLAIGLRPTQDLSRVRKVTSSLPLIH